MRYGLIPKGPARRAVVFGGWNIHMFHPDVVDGDLDVDAARAFIAFSTGPEWSTKFTWDGSNPGNLRGFRTSWMKERLEQIKFLDVTTSMLPYGIAFPAIPEATEIMNIIVPDMMQNALTQRMTVAEAADQAARQMEDLMEGSEHFNWSDLPLAMPLIPGCTFASRVMAHFRFIDCNPVGGGKRFHRRLN